MSESRQYIGFGLPGALFLLFLGLQLHGDIDWPWYAVAAPLWVPWALVFAVLAIVLVVYGVARGVSAITAPPKTETA